MGYNRPLPIPDDLTSTFWKGLKQKELLIPRCLSCGQFHFYPRSICPHCFSDQLEWVKVSGRGTLYSYTVCYKPAHPAFADATPYNIAIVELEEGVRLMSSVVGDHDALEVGMPLEVVFDQVTDEVIVPRFRPT